MLRNPVYTGGMVGNGLDFASARRNGGEPRLRAKEEWIIGEDAYLPLISDELSHTSQQCFRTRPRRQHASTDGT